MSYAEKILSISWDDLPDEVQNQSIRCLKDIIATSAGSMLLPVSGQAGELINSQYGNGNVPLWFRDKSTSFVGAAFYNALTIDSLDCHDGFRPNKGHAGATVVPLAVGACSKRPVEGKELLTAIVIGYEVACRSGQVIHNLYKPAFHSSGSWASLGAAAAGARLLGVPAESFDNVLGITEYYSPISPILRCTASPGVVKGGAGAGGWAAATALQMYENNMPGLPSIFNSEPSGKKQIASFGQDWMIMRQYFKLYPVCRWSQPAVEGVLYLKEKYKFCHEEIESIEISTFKEAATLGGFQYPPKHSDAAQFSMPWTVAAVLIDNQLGIEQIHPNRLCDPEIIKLGRKVKTRVSEEIQKRFPQECLAKVEILLKDGRMLKGQVMPARGEHTNPFTKEQMDEKFNVLVTNSLGQQKCSLLNKILETLPERSVCDLLTLL